MDGGTLSGSGTLSEPSTVSSTLSLSFVIVVRNGADYLPCLISDLAKQTLSREHFEVLVVDGDSDDDSPEVASNELDKLTGLQYRLIRNNKRILSTGWNLALQHAMHPVILRVDVHSRIAPDYLEQCVRRIESGESVVGGPVISRTLGTERSLIFAIETSRFAGGAAAFRRSGPMRYVDTLGYAAYHRSTFECVGGFDERLVRNQDNEMHCRIKRAGFKFFYDPAICSYHYMRTSWCGMLRQKFCNGYWIALASVVRPGCFSLRHLSPAVFLMALCGSTILALGKTSWLPLLAICSSYTILTWIFTVIAIKQQKSSVLRAIALMPAAFLMTHLTYGAGTIAGVAAIPRFITRHRGYRIPYPIKE